MILKKSMVNIRKRIKYRQLRKKKKKEKSEYYKIHISCVTNKTHCFKIHKILFYNHFNEFM